MLNALVIIKVEGKCIADAILKYWLFKNRITIKFTKN